MKRLNEWFAENKFAAAILVMLVIIIPGYIIVDRANTRVTNLAQCVSEWADDSSARSERISQVSQLRNDALDELIRSVDKMDRTLFKKHLRYYIEISDLYYVTLDKNPIPTPPKLRC